MTLQFYLVGGAVRDILMDREAKDRDYVVVGSSRAEMLSLGFEPVGVDFPVFLHPKTKEEYALARRERKVGAGYGGFDFEVNDVTLEDDLARRDLTINSMAYRNGELVDPFGGEEDLKNKVLRHTSEAFGEDPLRVVRLARFYARYNDFTIAPETFELAHEMVAAGQLNELPEERFWLELEKVLGERRADRFFELLHKLGAFKHVDFFRETFGDVSLVRLNGLKEEVSAVWMIDPDVRLDIFAAISSSRQGPVAMPSLLATMLRSALNGLGAMSPLDDADQLVDLFNRHRMWGNVEFANHFLLAAETVERLYGCGIPVWTGRLKFALDVGRAVKSDPYRHLNGPEIGKAMHAERVSRIKQVLATK